MDEHKFTYAYYDTQTYMLAGLTSFYIGLLISNNFSFVLPLIAFGILSLGLIVFAFIRTAKFVRRYKNIDVKTQRQILKRHRYSLNWMWLTLGVSILISFAASWLIGLNVLEATSVFMFVCLSTLFVLTRVFLRYFKSRLNLTPLS